MARMIPDSLPPDFDNAGEIAVFNVLDSDPLTEDWVVLHSLKLPGKKGKPPRETDFVILVPGRGICCLEVKSHKVIAFEDGRWLFGRQRKPEESPFEQAAACSFGLRQVLREFRRELADGVFTSLVCFPFAEQNRFAALKGHNEWPEWQLVHRDDLRMRGLSYWVGQALEAKAAELGDEGMKAAPDAADCEGVAGFLRPMVLFNEGDELKDSITVISGREERMTEEQIRLLRLVMSEKAVLVDGLAVTGKTTVAIEVARREAAHGLSTCLATASDALLQDRISDELASCRGVDLLSLEDVAEARARAAGKRYGCLIVDGFEDILDEGHVALIDELVVDGLEGGQIKLFADLNGGLATPVGRRPMSVAELIARHSRRMVTPLLTLNCRNPRPVAALVAALCRDLPAYTGFLREKEAGTLIILPSSPAEGAEPGIRALKESGIEEEDILAHRVDDFPPPPATAAVLKGRERKGVAVYFDGMPQGEAARQLYLAVTRCTENLAVCAPPALCRQISGLLAED